MCRAASSCGRGLKSRDRSRSPDVSRPIFDGLGLEGSGFVNNHPCRGPVDWCCESAVDNFTVSPVSLPTLSVCLPWNPAAIQHMTWTWWGREAMMPRQLTLTWEQYLSAASILKLYSTQQNFHVGGTTRNRGAAPQCPPWRRAWISGINSIGIIRISSGLWQMSLKWKLIAVFLCVLVADRWS